MAYTFGLVYQRLGRRDEAVEAFRRYLAAEDTGARADEARRHLEALAHAP